MTPRRTLAVAAAMCAVLATGCGQAEDETADSGPASPTTTPVVATTPTETETPTEAATEDSAAGAAPTETAESTPTATPTRTSAQRSAAPTASPTRETQNRQQDGSGGSVSQTTPGEYGDAAVQAWSAGDTATLNRYVASGARSSLGGSAPTGDLLRVACEGDMCSYTTEEGRRVTLTFDLNAVERGRTGGITNVSVD